MFGSLLSIIGGLIGDSLVNQRANSAADLGSRTHLDWLVFGVQLHQDGVVHLGDWIAALRREFGSDFDALTQDDWESFFDLTRSVSKLPSGQWRQQLRREIGEDSGG